ALLLVLPEAVLPRAHPVPPPLAAEALVEVPLRAGDAAFELVRLEIHAPVVVEQHEAVDDVRLVELDLVGDGVFLEARERQDLVDEAEVVIEEDLERRVRVEE